MKAPHARPGFTLLEVILAISMAVGLIAAVFAFYDRAVRVRSTVLNQVQWASMERHLMDRMTDELRSAIVYPFLSIGLEGATDQMTLMCTVLPGPAAWAVRTSDEDPIPPEHDIQLVGYRLRIYEDEDGLWHNDGLERTCQRILAAQTSEDVQVVTADLIAPDVHFLRLRYFDGAGWVDGWGGGDLPLGVEITLGSEPKPDEMEVEDYLTLYPTWRRVVHVPASAVALGGTMVRDAGGR